MHIVAIDNLEACISTTIKIYILADKSKESQSIGRDAGVDKEEKLTCAIEIVC